MCVIMKVSCGNSTPRHSNKVLIPNYVIASRPKLWLELVGPFSSQIYVCSLNIFCQVKKELAK